MGEIRTRRQDACPACGSTDVRPWRRDARDWHQPDAAARYEYARCRGCGARFASVRPVEEDVAKAYFEGYGPYSAAPDLRATAPTALAKAAGLPLGAAGLAIGKLRPDPLPARLERFYTPAAGDLLLDYGCGSPAFLDDARERGFETAGADFVPGVVEGVRAAGHRAGLVQDGLAALLHGEQADAVRLNHVVEHLFEPRQALGEIRAAMAPGGRIHLATPNPAGVGSRVYRTNWFSLDAPRHAVLYPPKVLAALMTELGFRDVEVVSETLTKDLVRSWAIRRHRGAVNVAAMQEDLHRARVAAPVARLSALAGASDRFHLFARA